MQAPSLLTSIQSGRPLTGALIIDCHAHIGWGYNHPQPRADAGSLVQVMDRLGVDRACISSSLALGPDVPAGNDEMLRALDDFPGRFVGAAVVNPRYPDEIDEELRRVFAHPHVGMVKVHPEMHAYPLDGPAYGPVWRFAEQRRIPVIAHTWGHGRGYDHPFQAERVARDHPAVPLILGHAGGTPDGVQASLAAAQRTDNLFLDTGTSLVFRGALELMVRALGAARVVFGSDCTYLALPPQLGKVVYAQLPDADKLAILGQNLLTLLRATRGTAWSAA
jgi:uncharacterized protein